MYRLMIALLAASGAAFSALAPAGANSVDDFRIAGNDMAVPLFEKPWRIGTSASGCRIELRWRRDFAGEPYLKKVRICA